ncbi:MAG: hypothetical protein JWO86_6548 [Myxococcaceae bacterium]|nr:hypothetical protein [Myxococcaceae bacterium]
MRALLRIALAVLVTAAVLLGTAGARADADLPSHRDPRPRTCCALARHLPLHLGAAHVPVVLGIVTSAPSLGPHSYAGDAASRETNGIVYTRRGGFIDTGHTREYADLTAHLIAQLRPLLARGEGTLRLRPRDGEVFVRITGRAPEEALAITSTRLAQRIAFQISIWVEISQHYGHSVMRGAEEYFSAFTPEDLYSNLFGTQLGASAFESSLPYDRAVDKVFSERLAALEVTSSFEANRILDALAGRWWRSGTPWPAPNIPILHSFDIGPHMTPVLAPEDVAPAAASPAFLEVPEVGADGAPLAELYRLEIVPDARVLPRIGDIGVSVITGDDLPRVVGLVERAIEAGDDAAGARVADLDERVGPVAHYLVGLRLFDLQVRGGLAVPSAGSAKGVVGGSLLPLHGDTRGGDFALMRLDVNHTAERGLSAGVSFFRTDVVYFCHDRETGVLRAPLLTLLGPCARGEWLGIGGSIGEAFHDGRTGRTALRPISLYGVLDVFGNGQSPSYDGLRLLLRGGGAVEHVWTAAEGGVTIPRTGGNALFLVRTPGRSLEARGATGYRLDPTTPRDAAFESSVGVRWYFVLGGNHEATLPDAVDPWGVASLGLEGSHSFWTRPAHSYAEQAAPFVSAERSVTWQVLVTATLGFEGLTF